MAYYAPPPPNGGASSIQGQLLEINVVGCKNLNDKEWFSRQDPYVCIEYGTTRHRTRTDTDGGKNPSFNEKFMVPLIEGLREINATVWNSNSLTYDDHIGSTRILIEKAISSGYDDTSWPLKTKSGKYAGELRLIMHYSNASKPGKFPGASAQVAPAPGVFTGHAPGYPPQHGYPPQQGYPSQQQGYPPQQQGYLPQQQGYPPQQQGYPPQHGYPPQQPPPGTYPPPQPGYPPAQYSAPGPSSQGYPHASYPPPGPHIYPPDAASYPAAAAYPAAPGYPPAPGYMPQPSAYPQGHAPFGVAPYGLAGAAVGMGMGMGAYGLHGQFKHGKHSKHSKHKHGKWGKLKYGKYKWK